MNSIHVKKLTFTNPLNTRRIGRPPNRWLDCVEEDLRASAIRRWKEKALDRNLWEKITEAVKAGKQLLNH